MRLRGADPAADLDDELTYHLERRAEEYQAQGMTPEEARRAAEARVGDLKNVRAECGDIARRVGNQRRRTEWVVGHWTEVRQAARRLRRRPVFTAAAVLTLALGIGAAASIFAVVNGVLLRPLPFDDPDGLVAVYHTAPGLGFEEIFQADGTYLTYRARNEVFEDLALWTPERASITGLAEAQLVNVLRVTDGLLPILRIQPVAGRRFLASDDAPGAPLTVMLSEGYWQASFARDPAAIGQMLQVGGLAREIIGVVPAGFSILENAPDILLPFRFDPAQARITNFSYDGVARLLEGSSPQRAEVALTALLPQAIEDHPRGLPLEMVEEAGMAAVVRPLKERAVGGVRRVLWTLFGTVALVLLIACANVAGLFLVRAEGQQQEVAVRAALGAGRRAARGMLIESWLLGLSGGVLGLGIAAIGVRSLVALGPSTVPRLTEIGIGAPVLSFTLFLSLTSALVLGSLIARRFGRPNLQITLRDAGRGGSSGRARHRLRSFLVVTQMALALVLLVGAGLMVRSLGALNDVHPGFERPSEVLTFEVSVPSSEEGDPERVAVLYEEILRAAESVPGVVSAALVSDLPMVDGLNPEDMVFLEDFPQAPGATPRIHRTKWVSGDYFETMGNPVLAGRGITWSDVRARANVVVVTEDIAVKYWGSASAAVGRRMRNEEEAGWREIVGVVGSVHDDGPDMEPVGLVYWPMVQIEFWGNPVFTPRSMAYVLRFQGVAPTTSANAVRGAVWSVNDNLPLANARTLADLVRDSVSRTSFTVVMLTIAAIVALALGVIGLYGVVSYAVATRTREIGVRIALGARRREVIGMVVGQGARLGLAGLAVGFVAALFATRILSALLFGVATVDPLTYLVTAGVLGLVAVLASYIPARRAARIAPTEALRHE